jgi:acetylornithine deacetylase
VGVDAIEKGMIVYNAIKDLERRWGQTKTHPMFKPGSFNLNAATIKAGVGPSLVAPEMEMSYGIFYCPSDEAETVKKEIEEHVHNACLNDPWLRANPPAISWTFNWPAFNTAADDPISVTAQEAVREVCPEGGGARAFFAVCDGCFIREKNIPVVVLGPGECLLCHTADERVSIDQLVQAAKIYALAIAKWCGI